MLSRRILSILGWFIAVLEVRAALTNATLIPPSNNIRRFDYLTVYLYSDCVNSLNGPGWLKFVGAKQCGELSAVVASGTFDETGAANVSVAFQGTAVYFVGWNYGPDIMYQAFVDGVLDLQFPVYTPSQPTSCGAILYSKTGLSNTAHTLEMKVLKPGPGGLVIKGFVITIDDGSGAPSGSSAGTIASVTALSGTPVSSSSDTPVSPSSGTPVLSSSTVGPSNSSDSSKSPGSSGSNNPGLSSSTPGNPGSPTVQSPGSFLSRPGGIGTVVGGTVGGLIVLGLVALWAHGVIQAMLGIFPWMVREFKFGSMDGSHQIILTLTPVDIDKAYPCEQVVWQVFTIGPGSQEFTAKLEYKRAFGIAIIQSGGNALNNERICKEPDVMASAKPGRALPFTGSAWDKPLQFMLQKRTRIIARNQSANRIPQRLVIGSYIGAEVDEEKADTAPLLARFQPFVVMEEHARVQYGEEFSATDDLILRAYKTKMYDAQVTQILSSEDLSDENKTVPLLGKEGVRLSTLPEKTTWFIARKKGSEFQLTREIPPWRKSGRSLRMWK
ncbi:hypothetical protein C8F04DRAFT_1093963 [Mycena alexandri]|uniref:Uncharacterized protein n=1 Tax=Mycena alexandri TaxID=1745969 RepID=A0AAD6T301_9AGAR|nr:hypothetical protein C8F04DRAFT_1093963 [Mycena alexandri]